MGKNRDVIYALFDHLEERISAVPGHAQVKLGKKARRDLLQIVQEKNFTIAELEELCVLFLTKCATQAIIFGLSIQETPFDFDAEIKKIRAGAKASVLH